MNSSLVGILREAAEHDEIEGVYGALFGIQLASGGTMWMKVALQVGKEESP